MKNDNNDQPTVHVNKLIHEPARLNLLAQLYVIESADFVFLMGQTGLTQGNLSTHLTKLEKAKFLKIKKKFVGKRPQTLISMTEAGRTAFEIYVEKMKTFLGGL